MAERAGQCADDDARLHQRGKCRAPGVGGACSREHVELGDQLAKSLAGDLEVDVIGVSQGVCSAADEIIDRTCGHVGHVVEGGVIQAMSSTRPRRMNRRCPFSSLDRYDLPMPARPAACSSVRPRRLRIRRARTPMA